MQANRVKLIHGSLMYRDRRLEGFDAASVIEVVEHLDPPRLAAFERVLFDFAKPRAGGPDGTKAIPDVWPRGNVPKGVSTVERTARKNP